MSESAEIVVAEDVTAARPVFDTHALMQLAIEKDGAIEVIERLAALREKEMERESEEEFLRAFTAFRRECPEIPRTKKGKEFSGRGGVKTYIMYAPLEGVQAVVDPYLAKHGFTYSWNDAGSPSTAEMMFTTCELRHVGGAMRTSTIPLPITKIINATGTQNYTGTRTTGKRLTLCDVLGISTVDDVDGEGDDGETISHEQEATLQDFVDSLGDDLDFPRFLKWLEVGALADLPAKDYTRAINALKAKKDK